MEDAAVSKYATVRFMSPFPLGPATPSERLARNFGEGCLDLKEEVLLATVAIGPALDDRDGVVDALYDAGIQWLRAMMPCQ